MWSQTLGHNQQIDQLRKALASGKVAHAYLFSGPEGIGKRRIAMGLAQGLNCLEPSKAPCGHCVSCKKIAKQIHPDCLCLVPEGKTIRIEVLRELKQKAHLHPLEGEAKVFIIEAAEKMTTAGANALLKILEEPPCATYLILISAKPSLILPTIRSRCQRLEFSPLPDETMGAELEKRGFALNEAKCRVWLAQGSLNQALNFDSELFAKASEYWNQLFQNPRPSTLLRLSEELIEAEETLPSLLRAFSFLVYQKIIEAQEKKTIPPLTEQWEVLQQTSQALDTFANKRLLVENLLFRLAAKPPAAQPS